MSQYISIGVRLIFFFFVDREGFRWSNPQLRVRLRFWSRFVVVWMKDREILNGITYEVH